MHVTALIYSYPREAQYSYDPSFYDGSEIEDYDVEISTYPPKVGETRSCDGKIWAIANIETYEGQSEQSFCLAILTLDGKPVELEQSDAPFGMYIICHPGDTVMGWPEIPDGIPQVGDRSDSFPGWEVAQVYDFDGSQSHHYSSVRVCWCGPIQRENTQPERGLAEAIA